MNYMRSAILLMVTVALVPIAAQKMSPARLDDWEALDLSLRQPSMKSDMPRAGFVPNEKTAVAIAVAVASALYGESRIHGQLPFRGRLRNGVWTVMGTVHPIGAAGGTAVIKLNQKDGKILFAVHQY